MCQTTCSHMFRIDIIDGSSSRRKKGAEPGESLAKVLLLLQRHLFNKLARGPGKDLGKGAGEALIPKPMPGCAGRQNGWATAAALDLCLCPGTPLPRVSYSWKTPVPCSLAKTKAAKCQWSAEMRITLKSSHAGQTGARTHTFLAKRIAGVAVEVDVLLVIDKLRCAVLMFAHLGPGDQEAGGTLPSSVTLRGIRLNRFLKGYFSL